MHFSTNLISLNMSCLDFQCFLNLKDLFRLTCAIERTVVRDPTSFSKPFTGALFILKIHGVESISAPALAFMRWPELDMMAHLEHDNCNGWKIIKQNYIIYLLSFKLLKELYFHIFNIESFWLRIFCIQIHVCESITKIE